MLNRWHCQNYILIGCLSHWFKSNFFFHVFFRINNVPILYQNCAHHVCEIGWRDNLYESIFGDATHKIGGLHIWWIWYAGRILQLWTITTDGQIYGAWKVCLLFHFSLIESPKGFYLLSFFNFSSLFISYQFSSLGHFATNVCAIIGGLYSVAGIIDAILNSSLHAIKKKIELGKFS